MSGFQKGATYDQIKAYVLEHTGLKVSSLYISQVKRKCGLDVGQNYNLLKKESAKVPQCPLEKEAVIMDALKHFGMIQKIPEYVKFITQEDADKINSRSMVSDDDILFAMIGSIGNPVLVKKDREFCIKNMALFKKFADTDISMQYMYWFFFFIQYKLKKEASGGVQSFISLSRFREYLVPLPPYEEQIRIANKIEQILPLCERLK